MSAPYPRPALIAAGLLALAAAMPAAAGNWSAARTLESFGTASIPEPPLAVMNASGHALLAWNATGILRYAERVKGGAWQPSRAVPGGGTGSGPVAVAIGRSGAAAIAYTTTATRYTPSMTMVSLRSAGGGFGAAAEPVPGVRAGVLRLGIACDGSVTLVWGDAAGLWASTLAGTGDSGACDGQPGAGAWQAPQLLSAGHAAPALPDLVVNDAGAALVVWQDGGGSPGAIAAALRPAGGSWEPAQTVSPPDGQATWNPKAGLDAAGGAAVGYLAGNGMVVARRPAGGAWGVPVRVSGTQNVRYPAFAMGARGEMVAAWQSVDASGLGMVWSALATPGGVWGAANRLSARAESAGWPMAAIADDGALAVVGWTDDGSNTAKAAVYAGGAWRRSSLGTGYWGATVSVGTGGGAALAGWGQPNLSNPNAAKLVARTWQ